MTSPRTSLLAAGRARVNLARSQFALLFAVIASVMVVNALLCNGIVLTSLLIDDPVRGVVAAAVALCCGLPYLLFMLWLDRNEPEPAWLIAGSLVWGGATATGVSLLFNQVFGVVMLVFAGGDAQVATLLTASFVAPFVEELAKGVALVLLYLFFRKEFDTVLDGVIYGALIGLGFAVVENWLYYMQAASARDAAQLMVLRGVITSAGTHICFTAMLGASIGLFRVSRSGVVRWLWPLTGLAAAMFAHFVWNTFAGAVATAFVTGELAVYVFGLPLAVVILQAPFIGAMVLVAWLASRHERWVIRVYLADETVLRDDERRAIVPTYRRLGFLSGVLASRGVRAWWAQRRRFHFLVRLVFEKWHMAKEADDGSHDARTHAVRVQQLRRVLAA